MDFPSQSKPVIGESSPEQDEMRNRLKSLDEVFQTSDQASCGIGRAREEEWRTG
jgi:hypothetical protein